MIKKELNINNKQFTKPYTFTSKKGKYKVNYKQKPYKSVSTTPAKKYDPWLDGTFAVDPQTWECKHIPAKK